MSKLTPQYTTWEAINAALSVGMRALEEIRALARTPGKQGEPGKDGAPGKLPLVKEWTDEIRYKGDVCAHDRGAFQALRDTAKEPPHEDWICIASAGSDGQDGRTFTIRGTWTKTDEYRALDVVALGGASFAARRDDPGVCPGEGWQLIAAQGKRGNAGERGTQGQKGDRGLPGMPVIAMAVDANGLLTLTNGDGTEVTCDLYPLLAKL